MRDLKKLEEIQDSLTKLIAENKIYFDKDEAEDVARSVIESFMNDKRLPYASTPPSWLAEDINRLLSEYEQYF